LLDYNDSYWHFLSFVSFAYLLLPLFASATCIQKGTETTKLSKKKKKPDNIDYVKARFKRKECNDDGKNVRTNGKSNKRIKCSHAAATQVSSATLLFIQFLFEILYFSVLSC